MARYIQKLLLVACVLLGAHRAEAFSLIGVPEAWQVSALGHNEPGDIGAEKNLGEEYRWNIPVITYGFDSSFLNYFGANGVAAVDAAFAILNSLPPMSALSSNLTEYPLLDPTTGASTTFQDSRRVNPRAEANNLLDLKSITLHFVLEQLGLADPERFVWTLRDRQVDTQPDPDVTNYLVIQRNFDPVTGEPSKYVNGTRYTYEVLEDGQGNSDAFELPVDPEHSFSSVAGLNFNFGEFYTYLTRDDIGGLRYIYHPTNVNVEPFPPNTQALVTDTSRIILLTNQDLTLFSLRSRIFSPAELSNAYPGLIITQAVPSGQVIVSNLPVLVTNTVPVRFFTNTDQLTIVSNTDLGSFTSFLRTNNPAAVQAAFPNLVLTGTNAYATQLVSIGSITITNVQRPWDDPFTFRTVFLTNYVTNLVLNYNYTAQNILTNYYSPITVVRQQITGVDKEPWSDAANPVYKTNIQDFIVTEPSGGILIVPTNLIGYQFTTFLKVTNVIGTTNVLFQTNFVDTTTGLARTIQQSEIRFFTNVQYAVYPIELVAPGQFTNVVVTNGFTTNIVITYDIGVGNVITNYSFAPTPIIRYTREIVTNQFGLAVTNTVQTAGTLPVPTGGFLVDTNLTGFEIIRALATNVIPVTNLVYDVSDPAGRRRLVEEYVYSFTNVIYSAFAFTLQAAPAAVLRGGVDKLTFVRLGDGTLQGNNFNYTNRFQVSYYTNGLYVRQAFQIIQTQPDFLFAAADLGPGAPNSIAPLAATRTGRYQNNEALDTTDPATQGGPGTVNPTTIITFSRVGPHLYNQFPGFTTEESVIQGLFFASRPILWGSFDGSTNAPVVYPKDITIEQIEARVLGNANP